MVCQQNVLWIVNVLNLISEEISESVDGSAKPIQLLKTKVTG